MRAGPRFGRQAPLDGRISGASLVRLDAGPTAAQDAERATAAVTESLHRFARARVDLNGPGYSLRRVGRPPTHDRPGPSTLAGYAAAPNCASQPRGVVLGPGRDARTARWLHARVAHPRLHRPDRRSARRAFPPERMANVVHPQGRICGPEVPEQAR